MIVLSQAAETRDTLYFSAEMVIYSRSLGRLFGFESHQQQNSRQVPLIPQGLLCKPPHILTKKMPEVTLTIVSW
jgi:hypothetical protein